MKYGAEIAVMRHMGWSYDDFLNAPDELVDAIVEHMIAEREAQELKASLDKAKAAAQRNKP